jgi:anthranilate synthase/aminodeoxychorismate synthase-like glutamine amidotransferase
VILLLDHRDSFVHTLAGYAAKLGADTRVVRDDAITMAGIQALAPERIVLSPGPCAPADCPLAIQVVREMGARVPILGVCLGHQVIAHAFGATVGRAAHPRHGRTSHITHDGNEIYRGIPSPFVATRYHSLAVDEATLPAELVVTARADDGTVMGIRHSHWPVEGVQFHPESILTEHGLQLARNWLEG